MLALRLGEELDETGRVRFEMRCNCRYEERWTLREGESVLRQYDYKAFHYVEILGLDAPGVELAECWMWERHYPMRSDLCTFSCGQDELGDIFRICKTPCAVARRRRSRTAPAGKRANTFGTNPSGGRWPRDQRWTGILQERLGGGFYVIEEGLGGRTAAAASRQLAPLYRAQAEAHGWLYLDAASAAGPSERDQLHMEAAGHRALAEAVEKAIRNYLRRNLYAGRIEVAD